MISIAQAAPGAEDVYIWSVDLREAAWDRLRGVLNPEETRRAEMLHTPALRQRYRRCRTALRCILAGYLQRPAQTLELVTTALGKPELRDTPLHFNVSHSGAEALVAVARVAIGVDIEVRDGRITDVDGMADWACHASERDALARMRADERLQAFYRIWTQKEAYCKGLGVGLQLPFRSICLEPLPGGALARVLTENDRIEPAYYAYDLAGFTGHASSVCVPLAKAALHSIRAKADAVTCAAAA
jgi:4'-phosphopantetheinyl transferase